MKHLNVCFMIMEGIVLVITLIVSIKLQCSLTVKTVSYQ